MKNIAPAVSVPLYQQDPHYVYLQCQTLGGYVAEMENELERYENKIDICMEEIVSLARELDRHEGALRSITQRIDEP